MALRLCGEWADYLALRERGREETLALNIYIIPHLLGFVKGFLKSFSEIFSIVRCYNTLIGRRHLLWRSRPIALDTIIIPHFCGFVKGF